MQPEQHITNLFKKERITKTTAVKIGIELAKSISITDKNARIISAISGIEKWLIKPDGSNSEICRQAIHYLASDYNSLELGYLATALQWICRIITCNANLLTSLHNVSKFCLYAGSSENDQVKIINENI